MNQLNDLKDVTTRDLFLELGKRFEDGWIYAYIKDEETERPVSKENKLNLSCSWDGAHTDMYGLLKHLMWQIRKYLGEGKFSIIIGRDSI